MSILKETNSLKDFQAEIMGVKMIVDMEKVIEQITIDTSKEEDEVGGFAINAAKYEILRVLLDVIFSGDEQIDDKMGYKSLDNSTFPFKLALNTLIEYKIIKEVN
jgi:hypothetical protein